MRAAWLTVLLGLSVASTLVEGASRVNAKLRAMETMRKRELSGLTRRSADESKITPEDLLNLPKDESLKTVAEADMAVGTKIQKLRQSYKGVPIFDAVVAVEIDKNGKLTGDASGMFVTGVEKDLSSVDPVLTKEEALKVALESEGDQQLRRKIADLSVEHYIYLGDKDKAHSIYYIRYFLPEPKRMAFIIDARSGEMLRKWGNLQTATCPNVNYVARGGNEKMGNITYGNQPYCLEPTVRGDRCYLENEFVKVIDMESTSDESKNDTASFVCSEGYNDEVNGAYSPATDCFFYGTQYGRMFRDWFHSTPLREKVILRVHYGNMMENAFWDGRTTSFGDGQSMFYPLTSADVVAHEIAHGVTEQGSGLVYYNQPGGLNEAFSDIMGEALEAYIGKNDMKVGHDIIKEGIFRDFRDPEIDGSSVGHVTDMYPGLDPHYSSGVYRRVFFVMIRQKGISVRQAAKVLLQANRIYWREQSTFEDAGCGVIKAAYDVGQNPTPYVRALDDIGVTACDASHHIRHLEPDEVYSDLTVSHETRPLFQFATKRWTDTLSIDATSAQGNVNITLRIGTWQDDEIAREDLKVLEVATNHLRIDMISNEVTYIELSSEDTEGFSDVQLILTYTCLANYTGPDEAQYRADCFL